MDKHLTEVILFVLNTLKNMLWPDKLDTYHDINDLLSKLSTNDPLKLTDADCDLLGLYVHSDGCSRVSQWAKRECKKHDFRYRTHLDFNGRPTTKWESDLGFLVGLVDQCNPCRGFPILGEITYLLTWLYPPIWIRFLGVVFFGNKAWNNKTFCRP